MRFGALALLLLLQAPPDRTVITREGKIYEGKVTWEGVDVVVTSSKGAVRLPAISVVAEFYTLPEARRGCEARLEQATKLFEEASAKPERDPMRRRQLTISI